jgi:hypothetical protein
MRILEWSFDCERSSHDRIKVKRGNKGIYLVHYYGSEQSTLF